ncbi:hypothetical protein [Chryseobacterium salivictor]|uniref:HNH endonuclease n=1 Tax=Chryseobacterium salivictor TaxID=2547600 RepID=A0A4V1ALF8_9FLAO|nr:hypothetical protein [Chryseobacterium salivictor]QBO59614.1 hypothetical protein NBC122_02813 [Chryseobacterium salivictor]
MRDDFSNKTKEILAKRVGYLCSNPNCRKHTSGPNSDQNKAINIGIAAHITAASAGGARYDETLSSSERQSIENGIWLCSNCASLIDRDETGFTVDLINNWKDSTEKHLFDAIMGKTIKGKLPFLEADMLWDSISRNPIGYSEKNIEVFEQPIPVGTDLYQYWTLEWKLKLVIYNNSEVPAYNLELIEEKGSEFRYLEKLGKINNIKPFDNIELEAIYEREFHGTSSEADEELTSIPKDFTDKVLLLKYFNDDRDELITQVNFDTDRLINKKI